MDRAEKLAARYLLRKKMLRTAGEVRFIKDRGGDEKQWGWSLPGPSQREMDPDFTFEAKNLKPLAQSLRSALVALGHVQAAYNVFTKMKSAQISPDGSLGGKGYIQRVVDIRRQFMNCSEALSAITDTLYDEIHASHWNPSTDEHSPRERDEVVQIMDDVEDIRKNPEDWAEDEEKEEFGEDEGDTVGGGDTGTDKAAARRVALAYLQRRQQ